MGRPRGRSSSSRPAPGLVQFVSALLATDDAVWVGYSDGTLDRIDPATNLPVQMTVTNAVEPSAATITAVLDGYASREQGVVAARFAPRGVRGMCPARATMSCHPTTSR